MALSAAEFFNGVRDAIHPDFHAPAAAGIVAHEECHHDGSASVFKLRASAQHVAFSLDRPGKNPFLIIKSGLNARNDLTVVCLSAKGIPLVFVIECKNTGNPGKAQHQIECGMAFCDYLFKLLRFGHGICVAPRYFGVAAYRPKTPPKGTTRPKFVHQGNHGGLWRTDWSINVELPLTELIRAAEDVK